MSEWTTARTNLLSELHGEGLSYSQIANAINEETGSSFTRNACIGKGKRIGLEERGGHGKGGPKRLTIKRSSTNKPAAPLIKQREPELPLIAFIPLNIPFMQLEEFHCREIVQDKGEDGLAVFCGHQIKNGTSWCPWHHSQNFTQHIRLSPEDRIKKHFQAIRNNRANSTGLRKYEIDGEEAA